MSTEKGVVIRSARETDLAAVNRVIESCVMGWDLAERVKRLSLNSYLYRPHDLDHLETVVAETPGSEIAAVAAWEVAAAADLPKEKRGLLLHGLYVGLAYRHQGIGSRLVDAALEAARARGMDGLLVKAQVDAVGFFQAQGFIDLPTEDPERDYPHRCWRPIKRQ